MRLLETVREAKMQGAASLRDKVNQVEEAFRSAFEQITPNGDYNHERWVIDVFEENVIARWEKGVYYAIPYERTKDGIVFAAADQWQKVERAFIPVAEALRIVAAKKAAEGEPEGSEWEVVIIGPESAADVVTEGKQTYVRSKNGRLYSTAALEASVPQWDGIKVYNNHLTDAEFAAKQGMRDVANDWLGVIVKPVWDAASHSLKGVLKLIDEGLRKKFVNAEKAGVLSAIGLSIDALGEGKLASVGGQNVPVIEKIAKAMSVDIVADPAAGGRLARMIAGSSPLLEHTEVEMDPEELKKLIESLIESGLSPVVARLQALEIAAKEAAAAGESNEEPGNADEETVEVPAAIQEATRRAEELVRQAEERVKLSECTHMLGVMLEKSGLPESYRELVAKQFRGKIFEAAALEAAIKEHREALVKLSESGQVILPDNARINVSPLSELDRYALSFLRLVAGPTRFSNLVTKENAQYHNFEAIQRYVEAGKPALPIERRLSEWYFSFTEDYDQVGIFNNSRLKEAQVTSSSLSSIVKNTVNLLLAADYSVREQWWEGIVRQEDVDTLDQATLVRVYGVNTLEALDEGDAYNELGWADEEETSTYQKYGNYIGVTLETFLLDKLARLRSLPVRLADAAYNTVSALVSGVFTISSDVGPTLADTGALFNATAVGTAGGHANLLTTALSFAAYGAARTAMMKQTDQPLGVGRRLMIQPRYLLVPVDLETTALQIRNSEMLPGSGNNDVNPYYQKFDVVPVPDWTDTNNFALVADPARFPAIWLIWLRGRRTPEIFSATDESSGAMFTNDELRYKVRQFTFRKSASEACAPVGDFRPLHKSNVA